jgi:hypothetical protein
MPTVLRLPTEQASSYSTYSATKSTYGGSSIRNYVYGVRAWHILHGIQWKADEKGIEALLVAGKKMAPKESRKGEKTPWSIEYLTEICSALNQNDPKDAAILACLTTTFWGTARLGEGTVPNLKAFNPSIHVKVSDVQFNVRDRNNLKETIIFLLWTKVTKEKGERIFWAAQKGTSDPLTALRNHLQVNKPDQKDHLFAFKHKNTTQPMTWNIFLTRISQIATSRNIEKLPGHGIRIGSTVEYLL